MEDGSRSVLTGRRLPEPPIIVKPRKPVLSRAGIAALIAGFGWLFVSGITMGWLMNEAHLVGDDRPVLAVLLAFGPILVLFVGALLEPRRGFRWMARWPQPEARLDVGGLELVLPDVERRRWRWEEIGGLEPAPPRGLWRRIADWGAPPNARLVDPTRRSVADVPRFLIDDGRGHNPTLADSAVSLHPDRYGFLDAGSLLHEPWFFSSLDRSIPIGVVRRSARRRRIFQFGLVTASFTIVVVFVVLELVKLPA